MQMCVPPNFDLICGLKDPAEMPQNATFHQVCTVFLDKNNLQRKKTTFFSFDTITFDSSIYTMHHPVFIELALQKSSNVWKGF